MNVDELCDDLTAEHDDLDRMVDGADLSTPTPAAGWTVGDQVSHLWFFDQRALLALDRARGVRSRRRRRSSPPCLAVARIHRSAPAVRCRPAELLERWREDRRRLVDHARTVDPRARVPWFGPWIEHAVLRHRPPDGDVGARPGRGPHPEPTARGRPTGCATSATSGSRPGGGRVVSEPGRGGPGRPGPRRAGGALQCLLDVGTGRCG